MSFNHSRLIFSITLILCTLLTACTSRQENYAPVSSNNYAVNSKIPANAAHPAATSPEPYTPDIIEDSTKYHVVKKGETLYSIGVSSGHGYQRLALWNLIAAPYKIEVGQKIRLFNPDPKTNLANKKQHKTAVAKKAARTAKKSAGSKAKKSNPAVAKSTPKPAKIKITSAKNRTESPEKSIISIDNQKMLKLSFQWPIKGKILKNFSQSANKGIDISGKIGQPVYAAEAGKVVYSGQGLIGFGNLVIIKHDDLYLSAYANNSRLLVAEGQKVEKGQDIAEVGEAGYKKAALHFEIRKNGKSVNPLTLLPQYN
ncbi:Lipoprotein NlpD [Candidatus Methylobacter favarea]|uniref:Lipoprotein NlpD n=1 Tax=Candidatus Methylobacter favarea TaxID=2707345 RepID=A0A8S0Y5Q1_9GAMM|nr:peptidoglycan DD-metalloendopeptidase family protein [Candidatus Methylobacter favarea]CAA9889528.1 Lipoprotein NlpD [Candidatus Methylobacter favarea]